MHSHHQHTFRLSGSSDRPAYPGFMVMKTAQVGSSFSSVPSKTRISAPALMPVRNEDRTDSAEPHIMQPVSFITAHISSVFHTMPRETRPLPLWIVRICWATTESTSKSILLNSSKQAQAPQDSSPWEKRVMEFFSFIWLNIMLTGCSFHLIFLRI